MSPRRGRPATVSRPQLREAAWALFERDGFGPTTVADMATATGISSRTFFRYYESKSALVWAEFDADIRALRRELAAVTLSVSLPDAIRAAVADASISTGRPPGRQRLFLALITREPGLLAASAEPLARWRAVVAEYAADRLGGDPVGPIPTVLGYHAQGAWLAGCELWLNGNGNTLRALVDLAFQAHAGAGDS